MTSCFGSSGSAARHPGQHTASDHPICCSSCPPWPAAFTLARGLALAPLRLLQKGTLTPSGRKWTTGVLSNSVTSQHPIAEAGGVLTGPGLGTSRGNPGGVPQHVPCIPAPGHTWELPIGRLLAPSAVADPNEEYAGQHGVDAAFPGALPRTNSMMMAGRAHCAVGPQAGYTCSFCSCSLFG